MSTAEAVKSARDEWVRGYYQNATDSLHGFLSSWSEQGQNPPEKVYVEVQLEIVRIAIHQGYLGRARALVDEVRTRDCFTSPSCSQAESDPLLLHVRLISSFLDFKCGTASVDECATIHQQVWEMYLRHKAPSDYTEPVALLELAWHQFYITFAGHPGYHFPEYVDRAELVRRSLRLFHWSVYIDDHQQALDWVSVIASLDRQAVPDLRYYVHSMQPPQAGIAYACLKEWDTARELFNACDHRHGLINIRSGQLLQRLRNNSAAATLSQVDQEATDVAFLYEELDNIAEAIYILRELIQWKRTHGYPQLPLHLEVYRNLETRTGSVTVWQQDFSQPLQGEEYTYPESQAASMDTDGALSNSRTSVVPVSVMVEAAVSTDLPHTTKGGSWLKACRSSVSRATNFLKGEFSEERLSRTTPLSLIEFTLLSRNVLQGIRTDAAKTDPVRMDSIKFRKMQALATRLPPLVQSMLDPDVLADVSLMKEVSPGFENDMQELGQMALDRPNGDCTAMPQSPSQIINRAEDILRKPRPEGAGAKIVAAFAHSVLCIAYFRLQDPIKTSEHAETMLSILDQLPKRILPAELKKNITAVLQFMNHSRIYDPPADTSNDRSFLENARGELTQIFTISDSLITKINVASLLGILEAVSGDTESARESIGRGESLIDTSGLSSEQRLRSKLSVCAASIAAAQDGEFGGIHTVLQDFEALRQADPESAKPVAQAAGNVYFSLGYKATTSALEENEPDTKIAKLREARIYHQAGLGSLEYGADLGTKSYSQFLWALGETWKYEGITLESSQALQEAINIFRTAEDLLNSTRYHLASSETDALRAFDAKTYVTGRFDTLRLFSDALYCHIIGYIYADNDVLRRTFGEGAWGILQRQKSRSIVDILTKECRAPWYMVQLLQAYPDQLSLLKQEETQRQALSQARSSYQRSTAGKKLEDLRQRMRDYPLLDDILRFQSGEGLRAYEVLELASMTSSMTKKVCFIDWSVFKGSIIVFCNAALANDRYVIRWHGLGLSIDAVSRWVKSNLSTRVLSDLDLATIKLKELSGLVAPLSLLTDPGDLLVLCPTGILQQIPLHALEICDDQILLERNPIVYTASHSMLRYQAHALGAHRKAQNDRSTWAAAVLAVYDESDSRNPPQEVAAVHSSIAEVAVALNTTPKFGTEVTVPMYQSHINTANLIHFHGHAVLGTSAQDQALILHPDSPSLQATTTTTTTASNENHLTVRRIFSETKFTQSPLIVNIACNSNKQDIMLGDEPLGLNTAFIYAGAQAVIGTLWSLRSADGRKFSRLFYDHLSKQAKERQYTSTEATREAPIVNLAVALQESALQMRDEESTEAPYHWASFVLSGVWEYKFGA